MNKKDGNILKDLKSIIDRNEESNVNVMILYSLINSSIPYIDNVMELSDEKNLEVNAKDLKKFLINFKVSNNLLSQMIKSNIDEETFMSVSKKCNLDLEYKDVDNLSSPPLSSLIGYNNILKESEHLIDDNLIEFLSYLEKGSADNALLKFEELTNEQKVSLPEDLNIWLANNSVYC